MRLMCSEVTPSNAHSKFAGVLRSVPAVLVSER